MASSNGKAGKMTAENCCRQASYEGLKSAAVACAVSTAATFVAVRSFPWVRTSLNHTGRALVVSGASIAAYFITADKAILKAQQDKASGRYIRS